MKHVDSLNDDEFVHLVRRAVALPDAPPLLVRAAIKLWPPAQPAALKDLAQAAVRLVNAVLSFDSWASPALAPGMRGVASESRHLLFSTMGRDIDLRINPAAQHFELTGQVLGPDESGMVELVTQHGDAPGVRDARVASLDALGEFHLGGVRGGTYQLTLRLGSDRIVLPLIDVGERPR